MAMSRFWECMVWAPARAGPKYHYEPGRPQTIQAAPEENQLATDQDGFRALKNIKGAIDQTYPTHAAWNQT